MRGLVVALLFFVTAVVSFTVTSPTDTDTWPSFGDESIAFTAVSSDPEHFAVVLSPPPYQPSTDLFLIAQWSKSQGSPIPVRAPAGGFPPGTNIHVNFVSVDPLSKGGILAQSKPFTITESTGPTTTAATTTTTRPGTARVTTATGTDMIDTGTATGTDTLSGATSAPTTSWAPSGMFAAPGAVLFALASALAAFMA